MADTYEKDLGQKSSLTASDFIRVVGSDNVSYKQAISNVMTMMGIVYIGTLSGSSDADVIRSAMTALRNSYSSETSSTTNTPKVVAFFRSGACGFIGTAWVRSSRIQMSVTQTQTGTQYFGFDDGSTQTVITQPTRAEVDALNSKTQLTLTRTEQDHVSTTSFNRLSAVKKGNMLTLYINLEAVYSNGFSGFEKIGTISGWSAVGTSYINIPSQSDGSKVLVLYVNATGDIYIYSATSYAGSPFFRGTLTTPCA